MKISFLGGAKEVGASCMLLELHNKNILLDCGIMKKNPSFNGSTLEVLLRVESAEQEVMKKIKSEFYDYTGCNLEWN